VRRRNRLADERVAEHLIVGADDAGERGDHEHPARRQPSGQGQHQDTGGEDGVDRAHRREHHPSAEPVPEHAEHRRGERAEKEQRAEGGEQQDRAGLHHHVPAQDDRLHLECQRREKVGGPLEAEATDAERGG